MIDIIYSFAPADLQRADRPAHAHARASARRPARHAACSVRFVRLRNLWIAIIVVAQKSRGDLVQNFLPLNNEKLTQCLYSIKGFGFSF